jgi:predicted site-specific integrase-resolvase
MGLVVHEWVKGVSNGTDLRRERFLAVMDAVDRGEVATLVAPRQDRLAQFGSDYLEHAATRGGRQIVMANQGSVSRRQELVGDLLAVVRALSGELDGLHCYEKTLKDELSGGAR